MAHTYVITSATSASGVCTITGTVDGFPVSIQVNLASITALPSTVAVQNFIAPLMLAQAIANGSIAAPTVVAATAAGTFSQ